MREKILAMMIGTLALALTGCGETSNYNLNANANRTANANVMVANTNTKPTPSPRRGVTREEYERDKDRYSREAKDAGRTVGTGLNDGWLWVKTRFELAAADDLRDSTINVDVDKRKEHAKSDRPGKYEQVTSSEASRAQVAGVHSGRPAIREMPGRETHHIAQFGFPSLAALSFSLSRFTFAPLDFFR